MLFLMYPQTYVAICFLQKDINLLCVVLHVERIRKYSRLNSRFNFKMIKLPVWPISLRSISCNDKVKVCL